MLAPAKSRVDGGCTWRSSIHINSSLSVPETMAQAAAQSDHRVESGTFRRWLAIRFPDNIAAACLGQLAGKQPVTSHCWKIAHEIRWFPMFFSYHNRKFQILTSNYQGSLEGNHSERIARRESLGVTQSESLTLHKSWCTKADERKRKIDLQTFVTYEYICEHYIFITLHISIGSWIWDTLDQLKTRA